MTIKVRSGGVNRTATSIKIKVSGVLRTVRSIRVMSGGVLRTAYIGTSALSASASPSELSGLNSNFPDPGPATTQSTTVTPSGGVAPFTYSWALISSADGTPAADNPSFATTTFTQSLGVGQTNIATFRCTVTDSLGATATADVTANFE